MMHATPDPSPAGTNQDPHFEKGKTMAHTLKAAGPARRKTRRRAQSEYRLIFTLSLVFFLIALLPGRILQAFHTVFFGSNSETHKSLLTEAREAANSVLPYAFIG